MTVQASITCPDPACEATSYHPDDIRFQYCGRCNRYHDDIIRSLRQDLALAFTRLSNAVSAVGMSLGKWAGRGQWALCSDGARNEAGATAVVELDSAIAALTEFRTRLVKYGVPTRDSAASTS